MTRAPMRAPLIVKKKKNALYRTSFYYFKMFSHFVFALKHLYENRYVRIAYCICYYQLYSNLFLKDAQFFFFFSDVDFTSEVNQEKINNLLQHSGKITKFMKKMKK